MNKSRFIKAGHWPTLVVSWFYVAVSFMVWTLIGATSVSISQELPMAAYQQGLLIALPLLGGACLRIVLGILADRFGGKKVAVGGLLTTLLVLAGLWLQPPTLMALYVYGFLLGTAGASFAIVAPLIGRWYAVEQQGLALGIAGAGHGGIFWGMLFGPRLALAIGDWQQLFGVAMVPVGMSLVGMLFAAKDVPALWSQFYRYDYRQTLTSRDTWLFALLSFITVGSLFGLLGYTPFFLEDQYGISVDGANVLLALCVIVGSLSIPLGGWLADKGGGVTVLKVAFFAAALLLAFASELLPLWVELSCWCLSSLSLGLGSGAVVQLTSARFPQQLGMVTGITSACGALGMYFTPILLGLFKQMTGTHTAGFLLLTLLISLAAWLLLLGASRLLKPQRGRPYA